ncbi:MAG: MFS transporter [Pirellulaceae bacterium]
MASNNDSSPGGKIPVLKLGQATVFLICLIASIGFAFDIYELLMLPLILRSAALELGNIRPGTPEWSRWLAAMFFVPAVAGGVFGLLGGYLTDRFGRRRVLTYSILLYAFSAFLAGFSTNLWMLLLLRSTTFIGVCVEFVAAVAWLAELFPDPKKRERVLGYTQAASSLGGLMVAVVNGVLVDHQGSLPMVAVPEFLEPLVGQVNETTRQSGLALHAHVGFGSRLAADFDSPFLPESPAWRAKREAGTLKRPSLAAIFSPELKKTTILTTLGFASTLGIAFGAIQQMPQIVPGLSEVKQEADEAVEKSVAKLKENNAEVSEQQIKAASGAARGGVNNKAATEYTKVQEIGGLVGRILMALALMRVLYWGRTLRMFQAVGLILIPVLFFGFVRFPNTTFFSINLEALHLGILPITTMSVGMFVAGLCVVAQLSFWGNYLPHVYPMHLRGTGESFAANIGGRMIGTSAAAMCWGLAPLLPFENPAEQASTAAAIIGGSFALVGFIVSFFLPQPMPEEE